MTDLNDVFQIMTHLVDEMAIIIKDQSHTIEILRTDNGLLKESNKKMNDEVILIQKQNQSLINDIQIVDKELAAARLGNKDLNAKLDKIVSLGRDKREQYIKELNEYFKPNEGMSK